MLKRAAEQAGYSSGRASDCRALAQHKDSLVEWSKALEGVGSNPTAVTCLAQSHSFHVPERLLDEAGQRAQEVERGAAQAIEETAAVAAEEGEVAVAAEGVGGAFGYLGGLAEGAAALAPTAGEVAGAMAATAGVNGGAGRWACRRRSLRPRTRRGLGAGEHALPAPAGQRGRGRAGRPVRQQHERRHTAPALHSALRQQHFRQPRKQPRLLAAWLQSPGADQSHTAPGA